jgi:tetratricopeptide (TPR) repeat protein
MALSGFLNRFLSTLLLMVIWFGAIAQTSRIDSLRKLIDIRKGTERADALNDYSAAVFSYDYQQSRIFVHEAYAQSEKLKYNKGMVQALITEGIIETSTGHDSAAMKLFNRSLKISRHSKLYSLEGNAQVYIGQIFQNLGRFDSTEVCYQKAYVLLKDSVNPLYLSYLYLNMARLYKVKNDQSRQLSYLLRSWNIRKNLGQIRPFVWIGIQLSVYYTERGEYEKSLAYLDEIKKALGKDTINNEEISIIAKERAIIYARTGDYKAALDLFSIARKYYERNVFPADITNLYTEIGSVLSDVSNYETSLKYYLKALELAQTNHFEYDFVRLNIKIAWVYFELEQNEVAQEYCHRAYKEAIHNNFPTEEASALNLLGLLSEKRNNDQEALSFLSRSLQLRIKNGNRLFEASSLLNMGRLFEKLKNFKKAEEYELKGLAINQELNNANGICESYKNLGHLYIQLKDYQKAADYLGKAERLAKSIHAGNFLTMIYKNQMELFQAQAMYEKAFHNSMLYERLKDSLFSQNLSNRISTMQHDYELDKLDRELKLLNQEQQLNKTKISINE